MSEQPAVETRELRKSYGDVVALRGVDLNVEPGIVFGLLGPNGAGKTTAVRNLTTLLRPDAGTARVAGLDVVRDAARLRERIGLGRRPEEGLDRPLPVVAHVGSGSVLTGRLPADIGTNVIQLAVMIAVGNRSGLPLLGRRPGGGRRNRAPAPPGVRVLLGLRVHRAFSLFAGGFERVRVHHHLSDHVRLVRVRAGRVDAGVARADRRGEPVHDDGRRDPRALFLGTPAGNDVWGAVVRALAIIVFGMLSVWRYRRAVIR